MDIAPPSVNLSPLDAILARAKSVMAITDNAKPIVLSETTLKQTELEELNEPSPAQIKQAASSTYTNEQVMASNLPQSVKEAMINKRIPPANQVMSNLVLEDYSELDDIKMIPNKRPQIQKQVPKQVLTETRNIPTSNSDMITISKTELKSMINEGIMTFLSQSYNKSLTEEVIKKTMNILIKEGRLDLRKPIAK